MNYNRKMSGARMQLELITRVGISCFHITKEMYRILVRHVRTSPLASILQHG